MQVVTDKMQRKGPVEWHAGYPDPSRDVLCVQIRSREDHDLKYNGEVWVQASPYEAVYAMELSGIYLAGRKKVDYERIFIGILHRAIKELGDHVSP
jgi:hypothetical protein